MLMIEAQDAIIDQIKTLFPLITVADNIVENPGSVPYIAVEPDDSDVECYAGGTLPPEKHIFSIYAIDSIDNHAESIRNTRGFCAQIINTVLSQPRIYALGKIQYGNDAITGKRCCYAVTQISYPI